MPKAKDTRVRLTVKGESRVWLLSYRQIWLLKDPIPWTSEEAIGDCGSRAIQMLDGLVKTGLMRKVGRVWRRTALGARVLREVYKG